MGVIEIFIFFVFDTQLNSIFVATMLSSNFTESKEFLTFYFSFKLLFYIVLFIVVSCVVLFMPYTLSIYILVKDRLGKILAGGLFLVSFGIICEKVYTSPKYLEQPEPILETMQYIAYKNTLTRYISLMAHSMQHHNAFLRQYIILKQQMQENLESKRNDIITNHSSIPNVVLILGESTQRNYMSVYGYPLATTPHLAMLQNSGNLIVFSDVIAPHSHTNEALQKVLTFSNYENAHKTAWFMQQNILDTLKLAGYTTHWLSNQEAVSIYGNAPEVISQRADITRFSSYVDSYSSGKKYDEALLPMLDALLAKKSSLTSHNKNFYVLHLMGTHLEYNGRYPKTFARFSPQDLQDKNADTFIQSSMRLTQKQLQIKSHYLNAIAYNDYIVSEIIKRFADTDSIVIYFSDHGEEVYDFRDFAGHTESKGSAFMVEIPFIIFTSQTFQQKHPHIVSVIENAKDKPFMTDDFIHALLDLLEIQSVDSISSRSIFNKTYNDKRKRIYANKDYDKELKQSNNDTHK